ncbi:MAG: hypothetical protein EOO43_09605 [Flavobacterium sp.]|nr:MAG: hypothetical protein EOO43_09605 [Flavobacterium sp.]
MGVLITYDVPDSHTELKKRMIAKGYFKTVAGSNGIVCHLPNTTLYRNINDPAQSIRDLDDCAAGLVAIERAVATTMESWSGKQGIPL